MGRALPYTFREERGKKLMMKVMETAEKYVYSQYEALCEENRERNIRYELIDGVIYFMSPGGASQAHQTISFEILMQLGDFLRDKPCKVFHAPFDVCLNGKGDEDSTTVQPDILVVCDESKLDGKRCNGAPDLVIEILSPSNRMHDLQRKFDAYMKAGVREYWIVDPEDKIVSVHILKGEEYAVSITYSEESAVPVHVFDGCVIDMRKVFN